MGQASYSRQEHPVSADSWLIRDDRAGTLTACLGEEIETAHQLLEFAELLADDFGFGRWHEDFAGWRSHCGETLRMHFAPEAAHEFYRGTLLADFSAGPWRQSLRAAVKAVEDMIQLLVTLRATLQGRGAASRARSATAIARDSGAFEGAREP